MIISLELKDIHDAIMLDAIIDAWKDKWKADDAELKGAEDDDADDEQEDRDDELEEDDDRGSFFPETTEEKAHREALEKLADALRNTGIADVDITYRRHAVRRNRRS